MVKGMPICVPSTFHLRSISPQMERSWNADGTQMERRWNAVGTQMERRWNADGTQMERSWNVDGTQLERRWNADRKISGYSIFRGYYKDLVTYYYIRITMYYICRKYKSLFWANIFICSDRGCTFCFVTFQIPGPRPWARALGQGPGPGPWAKALGPGPGPRP